MIKVSIIIIILINIVTPFTLYTCNCSFKKINSSSNSSSNNYNNNNSITEDDKNKKNPETTTKNIITTNKKEISGIINNKKNLKLNENENKNNHIKKENYTIEQHNVKTDISYKKTNNNNIKDKNNEIEDYGTAIGRYLDDKYDSEKKISGIKKGKVNSSGSFYEYYIKNIFLAGKTISFKKYDENSKEIPYDKGIITFNNINSEFEIEIKFQNELTIEFQKIGANNKLKKANISVVYKIVATNPKYNNNNSIKLNFKNWDDEIDKDFNKWEPKDGTYMRSKSEEGDSGLINKIKNNLFQSFIEIACNKKTLKLKIVEIKINNIKSSGGKLPNNNEKKLEYISELIDKSKSGIIKIIKELNDMKKFFLKVYANLFVERLLTEYKIKDRFFSENTYDNYIKSSINKYGNLIDYPNIDDINLENIVLIYED